MTNTPNMNLIEPTIGVDSGLVWEQSVNANSGVIDIHNHTPGYGVPINPAGLDINSDLSFNDFSAIVLKTTSFFNQSTVLSASTYPIALYAVGGDLYYNDNSNHQIKITSAGTVNATSSGITNGTNTASFVSNVLVVNEAANTPANIQAGSVLFGNNTAGSNFVTVSAPSALASNYTLTLPLLPTQQSFMTLDQFGNEAAPWTVDGSTIKIISNQLVATPQEEHAWELNGNYSKLVFPLNNIDSIFIAPRNITIQSVWIYCGNSGSGGTTEYDLQTVSSGSSVGTSILTTTGKVTSAAANNVWTDSGSIIGSQTGVTKPVIGTSAISAGTGLQFCILQTSTGTNVQDARIRIIYK
jgi:hypothetical protein